MKVVFLDRDGVINKEIGEYVFKKSQWEYCDGIFENLKKLQSHGFVFVIITNQGGVSKGLYSELDVENLMNQCLLDFKAEGIEILEYYFSPHHSDIEASLDRKPESLMIEKAIARFGVNPSKSFMIGDSARDVLAGQGAGVQSFLIDSNDNLSDIVEEILRIDAAQG